MKSNKIAITLFASAMFMFSLGDGTTLDNWATDVDFSQALWLGITVGAETLTPRIPLSNVAYARFAHSVASGSITETHLSGIGTGSSGQVVSSDGSGDSSWISPATDEVAAVTNNNWCKLRGKI